MYQFFLQVSLSWLSSHEPLKKSLSWFNAISHYFVEPGFAFPFAHKPSITLSGSVPMYSVSIRKTGQFYHETQIMYFINRDILSRSQSSRFLVVTGEYHRVFLVCNSCVCLCGKFSVLVHDDMERRGSLKMGAYILSELVCESDQIRSGMAPLQFQELRRDYCPCILRPRGHIDDTLLSWENTARKLN